MSKRRQPESKGEPHAKEQRVDESDDEESTDEEVEESKSTDEEIQEEIQRVETESDEKESDEEEKSTKEKEIQEEIQGELELCNCKFKTKDKLDERTKLSHWRSLFGEEMTCCAYTDHTNEAETRYFIIPSGFVDVLGLSKMISKWTRRKGYPGLVRDGEKQFIWAWDILEQFMFYGIEIKFDQVSKCKLDKTFTIEVSS